MEETEEKGHQKTISGVPLEKFLQLEGKVNKLLEEYHQEKQKRKDIEMKYDILLKMYSNYMDNMKIFLSKLNINVENKIEETVEIEFQKKKQIKNISYEFDVGPEDLCIIDYQNLKNKESPKKLNSKSSGIWDLTTLKEDIQIPEIGRRKTVAQITSINGNLSAEQEEFEKLEDEIFKIDQETEIIQEQPKKFTDIVEEKIKENKNEEIPRINQIDIQKIQKENEILAKKIGKRYFNQSVYLSTEVLARIIMGIDLSIMCNINIKDSQRKFCVLDKQTKISFDFFDYSPETFSDLRAASNIQEEEFRNSICEGKMKVIITPGKSGAILFFTSDKRFILKTVTDEELKFLKNILPQYMKYITNNPQTLICRIFALYTIKDGNHKFNFIAMENVFPSNVDESFDLKGSIFGRNATDQEKMKNFFKDNDVISRNTKLKMDRDIKRDFLHTITKDCNFLASLEIMDYSLLMGIVKSSENEIIKDDLKTKFTRMKSKDGKEIYYMGIIDILQKWNLKKKAEMSLKSVLHEKNSLSSIPPKDYSQRFLDFITTKLIN